MFDRLKEHVPDHVGIASVAKGVEKGTTLRPTQIIADVLGGGERSLAAICGPTVAHELAKRLPATVTAASDDPAFATGVATDLYRRLVPRLYQRRPARGRTGRGALKNVIALAAGILDGLQAGNNAKSALLARGLAEITRLGVAMGAKGETFFGLTGVGDLATTCFSPTGRNRSAGELLGKGRKLERVLDEINGVVEGVPTTTAVVELAERYGVEMPITSAINRVLFQGLDPLDAISELMQREPKAEREG